MVRISKIKEALNLKKKKGYFLKIGIIDCGINYMYFEKRKPNIHSYVALSREDTKVFQIIYDKKEICNRPKEILEESNDHGTAVLSIIQEFVQDAEFYIVRLTTLDINELIFALIFLIEEKVDIINMSMNFYGEDEGKISSLIEKAKESGIKVVVSASGYNPNPANENSVITVADRGFTFSDVEGKSKYDWIVEEPFLGVILGNRTRDFSHSTSIATPFVSGLIAYLLQYMNVEEIAGFLIKKRESLQWAYQLIL